MGSLETERAHREEAVRHTVAIADDLSKYKERLEALEAADVEEERCEEPELPTQAKLARRSRQKAAAFSQVDALELKYVGFEQKFASDLEDVAKRLTDRVAACEARAKKDEAQHQPQVESAPVSDLDDASFQVQLSQLGVRFHEVEREIGGVGHLQKRVEALENTQHEQACHVAHLEIEQIFRQALQLQDGRDYTADAPPLQNLHAISQNEPWVGDQSHCGNGYSSCGSDVGRRDSKSSFLLTWDRDDDFRDCLTKDDEPCEDQRKSGAQP